MPLQIVEAIILTTRVLIVLFLWQLLIVIIALGMLKWGVMGRFSDVGVFHNCEISKTLENNLLPGRGNPLG